MFIFLACILASSKLKELLEQEDNDDDQKAGCSKNMQVNQQNTTSYNNMHKKYVLQGSIAMYDGSNRTSQQYQPFFQTKSSQPTRTNPFFHAQNLQRFESTSSKYSVDNLVPSINCEVDDRYLDILRGTGQPRGGLFDK